MSGVLQRYYASILPLADYLERIVPDAVLEQPGDRPSYTAMLTAVLVANREAAREPTYIFRVEEPEQSNYEVCESFWA
jgi:hypothetical protein